MQRDKETKARLLISARQEFMEKGYMKASLRNICKNAGVTTGALYFFFQNKEELFASLVEEPLQKLYEIMYAHYALELAQMELPDFEDENSEDQMATARLVHYMYQYYDEFMLILTKSQGSRFIHCVDRFVEITERHYRSLADAMAKKLGTPPLEDYLIHWMAHMNIDMFVHLLTHETSEEAALQHVKPIVRYMTEGWAGLFQKDKTGYSVK